MRNFVIRALLAAPVIALAAAPAFSANDRCSAIACYDKVRTPDVYTTKTHQVIVRPGWREVVTTPPVVKQVAVPVVMRPGKWRTVTAPPVYATKFQRVLVRAETRRVEFIPAETRRVEQTVVVSNGGTAWVRTRGPSGRERLCKVRTPPVTKTITRDIVVGPARRIVYVTPAVYGVVPRAVVIKPATATRVYEAPVHGLINRSIVVRPATAEVVDHPPVVAAHRERVLLREGRDVWVNSRSRPEAD